LNPPEELVRNVKELLSRKRVAIFIVAYNAEAHIEKVLQRIPAWIAESLAEVFVIDDHSRDRTFKVLQRFNWTVGGSPLKIFRTPVNQGYGGNQKLGYSYAIEKNFDIVVLLHGDGQYAPEALPYLLAPYLDESVDAVFGSRFLRKWDALKGGMPLYKWFGNQILTGMQNRILGTRFAEMHSGYRSYRVAGLRRIPFLCNSNDFDFDADIIIQWVARGLTIREVPIPTYYGDEICHVNGMQYAWRCVLAALRYRAMGLELFYDPKFDIPRAGSRNYIAKESRHTIHHFIRNIDLGRNTRILDVGGGDGSAVSVALASRGAEIFCIDIETPATVAGLNGMKVDLDQPWSPQLWAADGGFQVALALDVIEHLKTPEKGVQELFRQIGPEGKLFASTGNVAFFPLRFMLALGQFNYGRRGILDLTHKRLFTLDSFKRLLRNGGFQVQSVRGFTFPLVDITGSSAFPVVQLERFLAFLARLWPTLFAYQILIEATRPPSHAELLQRTFAASDSSNSSNSEDEWLDEGASRDEQKHFHTH
jgi:glycosyltransferase involved in cell wall biosynthesis